MVPYNNAFMEISIIYLHIFLRAWASGACGKFRFRLYPFFVFLCHGLQLLAKTGAGIHTLLPGQPHLYEMQKKQRATIEMQILISAGCHRIC